MRKRLPLWLATAVPAMLLGHAAGYALAGRPLVDVRHGWFVFALQNSGVALLAICAVLVGCALFYSRALKNTRIQTSLLQLWPRMAVAQIALFACAESAEGLHVTALGILTQLAVAFCAAYFLSLFSRLLVQCVEGSDEAARYLARLFNTGSIVVVGDPAPRTLKLFACAGSKSFQRPPPFV